MKSRVHKCKVSLQPCYADTPVGIHAIATATPIIPAAIKAGRTQEGPDVPERSVRSDKSRESLAGVFTPKSEVSEESEIPAAERMPEAYPAEVGVTPAFSWPCSAPGPSLYASKASVQLPN